MHTFIHSNSTARLPALPPQQSDVCNSQCGCSLPRSGFTTLPHRGTCGNAFDAQDLAAENRLLASVPLESRRQLQAHLEPVELTAGQVIYDAGVVLGHVYFPVTAVISLVSMMEDGESIEVAVVGREGVAGVCAFMGGGVSLSAAMVQSPGRALRMKARAIAEASRDSAPMMQALLRCSQALFRQMALTAACNQHHSTDQKLCRWLLTQHDRVVGDVVLATHERIALMLGVRRESVSVAAMKLQSAGLIDYRRGQISILDRSGLKQRSCECHSVVENDYARLLSRLEPKAETRVTAQKFFALAD